MEMEKNEWLTGIEKQVARLRKLVNDLVVLSRLDEGRPAEMGARFSLSDAVCDTAMAFLAAAERMGKRLRLAVEPDVYVTGDEAALRQLTSILVDNAVKYADEGGEISRFPARRQAPRFVGGKRLPERERTALDRLFDRFYRFDPPAPATAATAWAFPSPALSPKPTAPLSAPKRRGRGNCACG